MAQLAPPVLRLAALGLFLVAVGCGDPPTPGDETSDAGTDAGPFVTTDGGTDAGIDAGTDGGTDGGTAVQLAIRGVTPPRGGLAGGTVVVLSGRGFVDGFAEFGGRAVSEQTQVSFGGNAALDVNVIDDDTIEVRSPSGARGLADVVLTNPNGTYTCEKCFTYFEAVELTRVTPTSGTSLGGEPFTLQGRGFVPGVLVLVGGNEATDLAIAPDGRSLTGLTPPGAAGSADVGVVGANSAAFLRRAFVYVAPMRITAVTPASSDLDGNVDVTLRGEGFTADVAVGLGGEPAVTVNWVSATELRVRIPAATVPGLVDVAVTGRRGTAVLPKAFAYFDPTVRALALFGVSPRQGPVGGGTCAAGASTCLVLTGTGLDSAELSLKIGGRDATFRVLDENRLEADLPPGDAGLADVQVRGERGAALLENAFGYVVPLSLAAIDPRLANAIGVPPVEATLTGTGLFPTCTYTIGASVAPVVRSPTGAAAIVLQVPPGSSGVRDVRVSCGEPASILHQEAVLVGAFEFASPLKLLQLDPSSGSVAGNTSISLFGSGFAPGMKVLFGTAPATEVDVKSPHLATVRAPRGTVGVVDVSVQRDVFTFDVLRGGYAYVDTSNILGGASGGPMAGTLNVTVLNSTPGLSGPVDGVTISINADQLVGITDDRGQVTFSDPLLLKPVTITGKKPKFAAATIARVDARNITLFMEMNEGEGKPSDPPPQPPPATITGRVCGFKLPPNVKLTGTQRLEARVFMTAPYVYAAPPFANPARPSVVSKDCGTYTIVTRRYGALALYAEFGIVDTAQTPASFLPLLMGIRRGLETAPDKRDEKIDIILDMHRDVSVPITVEPATAPPGKVAINMVFSYLDLGGEGVVPLAQTQSLDNDFVFERHPRVGGDGLMFLNLSAIVDLLSGKIGPPYSFYYRRQYGDLAAGVEIGPMLAFTQLNTPVSGGVFTGQLGWSFSGGQRPDLQKIDVEEPQGLASKPIWSVVLPGAEQGVSLPPSALDSIAGGSTMFWTVMTARSPRFDYNRFGYQQLGVTAWTSFTQDSASFTTY